MGRMRKKPPGKTFRWIRNAAILGIWALMALLGGCGFLYDWVGGNFTGPPADLQTALSPGAKILVARAFEEIDREQLFDVHVHLVGNADGGHGAFVNPSARSWLHPIRRAQYQVYLSASGVKDESHLDEQYLARLLDLIRHTPNHGRYFIYAMDRYHRPDGTPDPQRTAFFVPNEYVVEVARRYPDLFVPVISIHPYRTDALIELERWAGQGVRFVKWLPNSMGIDPSSEQIEPFYRKLKEHRMVLLIHTGRELAVHAWGQQHLGNPLLLRKPLDMGVTVVALHSASDGESEDLDRADRKKTPNFDLLMRLMEEPNYERLLYGELSAVTFFNRLSRPLETLLSRDDLHHRLVNGSDYPLPGVNLLIMTSELARLGFLTEEERVYLNEIYCINPLLFDLVVKRTLRHPTTGKQFPAQVFMLPPSLRPAP